MQSMLVCNDQHIAHGSSDCCAALVSQLMFACKSVWSETMNIIIQQIGGTSNHLPPNTPSAVVLHGLGWMAYGPRYMKHSAMPPGMQVLMRVRVTELKYIVL